MSTVFMVILLTGVVMAAGCGMNRKNKSETESKSPVVSTEKTEAGPFKDNFQETFGAADHITVEKVERTTTEDLDGNSKTEYAAYLVSDVNLKKESDHTEDYSASLKEEQMDDSLVKTVDFEEGFGFSYEGMDGRQVFEKLLETSGVDGDLNQAVYDKETYEMTKEKTYVLKNPCSVLEKMLQGTRYDELLENKVFYQTTETEDGKLVPDSITAVVQYRSGDETVTKSLFLQVSINNWRETEE